MRSRLSRWWAEVRRYFTCSAWLLALSLCLPAGAQPQTVPDLLLSLRCDKACVCDGTECLRFLCGGYSPAVTPPDPSIVYWPRYGFPERPLNIGDFTHNRGHLEAIAALERLWGRKLSTLESHDLSKVYCPGNRSARSVVIDRWGDVPQPCGDGGWVCSAMPQSMVERCLANEIRCIGNPGFNPAQCYLDQGRRVFFNSSRPECDPGALPPPPPPPPPPPEPTCGDGTCDPGEACPEDCPVEPPPPPPSTACEELWAAWEAQESAVAKVCPR